MENLGITEFQKIELDQPSQDPKLEEWEMGNLANRVDQRDWIDKIAEPYFGEKLNEAQLKNIKSDNKGDSWGELFEILLKWCWKTENNREVTYPQVSKSTIRVITSSWLGNRGFT